MNIGYDRYFKAQISRITYRFNGAEIVPSYFLTITNC